MTTNNFNQLAESLGELAGVCIAEFALLCLRAWLVSICASFFAPSFVLGFWEWALVVVTLRFCIRFTSSNKK